MSKSTRETVACPNCGHEDEVVIWSSLNNMISPNEANELLFGNLFGYACRSAATPPSSVTCLYHDMEKHAMVQYVPAEKQAEDTIAHLNNLLDNFIPPSRDE